MTNVNKKIFILDAYSLLYRAYYATRYLSTSSGIPTNALYGFTGMIYKIIEKYQPETIIAAFDAPGKTFRHDSYELYKSTRKPTPDDLKEQLAMSRDLLAALRIPSIELETYEADDIAGTIAKKCTEEKKGAYIITGDLDSLQLVNNYIHILSTRKGVSDLFIYDDASVNERYGFGPEYITDYKALVGDTSDAIPGLAGVGPKTAAKWINSFGSIENIIKNSDKLEPKWQEKINTYQDQVILSKALATIHTTVPIHVELIPYKLSSEGKKDALNMLKKLEFKSLHEKFPKVFKNYIQESESLQSAENLELIMKTDNVDAKYTGELHTINEALEWIGNNHFALYEENTEKQLSLFDTFHAGNEHTCYIAIDLEVKIMTKSLALELFTQRTSQVIIHNAKPWYKLTRMYDNQVYFDTFIAGYVLQPYRNNVDTSELIQNYLGIEAPKSPENTVACLTLLPDVMNESIQKEQLSTTLNTVELPTTPLLAKMEDTGISVDREILSHLSAKFSQYISILSAEIHQLAGEKFLISSPKQLGEVLFEKLKLPGGKKNKTGYATGAEILQNLAVDYPICEKILSWREVSKLQNTYADALPKLIGKDGKIHTNLLQTGAATGRLSSTEPNLQNIPIRTEMGKEIRCAFIASPGYKLVSCDYSQIELRLLAHMSEDASLVKAFNNGEDIHSATASLMFHIALEEVTSEQRRLAKILNFSVLYGVTEYGLANQLGEAFGIKDAKQLILEYYERFPSVQSFTQKIVEEARENGYTTTILGRKRYFPDIHTSNRHQRLYVERQAINAPIQGSAADMAKLAIIKVDELFKGTGCRILLQVHDELLMEIPENKLDIVPKIQICMENLLPLSVPIVVDSSVGIHWNEL